MSDIQYAPLTSGVIRSLTDKVYERRKAAALDVEKQVRDLFQSNQISQLDRLLSVLTDLIMSANPNQKKGGLIGMAASAIALGQKNAGSYSKKLIEPVLTCFNDPDIQIRYYACESLYNICKICRFHALDNFGEIFDVLWRVTADTDQNVRGGAELLDRLLMDIVLAKEDFDVAELMTLVRDRIYTQTTSNRRFIITWLNTIQSRPCFSLLPYISEVCDGLLKMLSDSAPAVRDATEHVLGQLLAAVQKAPDTVPEDDRVQIVNVLVVHTHEDETLLARKLSLIWQEEFLKLYKQELLPLLSNFLVGLLPAIDQVELKAEDVNSALVRLVASNKLEQKTLDVTIEVLLQHIRHEKVGTRVAVLNWIRCLHNTHAAQIFVHMHRIFPLLLKTLSDTSDDVLLLDLLLISNICQSDFAHDQVDLTSLGLDEKTLKELSGISPFLVKFSLSLLDMFYADPALLTDRGVLIIRQLCLLLEPSLVYRALCVLLTPEKKFSFIQQMVSTLHGVLLTATELFVLRDELRSLEKPEARSLFECLFRVWCHRPIALLGLCLLSQHYAQAAEIALFLSQVDITVDVLVEIDKLVNLIESPVLAYVRMDLLSSVHRPPLCTVLSALLMLLPQSEAFLTLHRRLQAIPSLVSLGDPKKDKKEEKVNFAPLLEHLQTVLALRQREIRARHRDLLTEVVEQMRSSRI
ncbi:unnamed protein product [Caenorhabditis auriculariae]|uniref:Protein VAC14 homolog n=1 Tax=Caenorhabditis auriculariae TaxID=2777116 RepID=A0A8S1GMK2_9PELO|nr:unnamed protein product [Caenorhabditis auriculariae]